MGNTELLVETMAEKIDVLKQRLAEASRVPAPADHLTACKLDCLMSMLPLLLGGPRAAAVGPAVLQDPGKLMKLEADKATLKAEKKTLEGQCEQLKEENKRLKEQNETLEARCAAVPAVTPMSFEEIAQAAFEDQPATPISQPPAELREEDLKRCMVALEGASQENTRLKKENEENFSAAQADCQRQIDELEVKVDHWEQVAQECHQAIAGTALAVTPAVTPPAPPALPTPETGDIVMEDSPVLGQGTCDPLTDAQRSYRVRKWNITPDPRTGERVPGQTLRSVNSIVSSPLRIPVLDDVGSRSIPVLSKDSLEIQRQLGGLVDRLKEVYQTMRPEIWTAANCSELQAQYVNDTKTMLSRLACQLVDAITRKAAANNVSGQVATTIPDALKAPCEETLQARIENLTPGGTPQDAGSAMVSALESLFQTWMTSVEGTDASDTIVHGIFCPILSKVGTCTWPIEVSASQALGAAWNAAR